MKYIAKITSNGVTYDKVADEVANKMSILGSWDGNEDSVIGKLGIYFVAKQIYKKATGKSAHRTDTEFVEAAKKIVEKEKEKNKKPHEHRKAKEIRAANQKHKRGQLGELRVEDILEAVVGFIVKAFVVLVVTLPIWFILLGIANELGNGNLLLGFLLTLKFCILHPLKGGFFLYLILAAAFGLWIRKD